MNKYTNIYISGYQVCGENGIIISEWLEKVLSISKKKIFFAPGPMIKSIETKTMDNFFKLNPILHINDDEAKSYTQESNVEKAIKILYEKNKNLVFITLGAKGTLFYDGKKIKQIPTIKTNVVDTVGAGDSHIGAIIAGLSKGMNVEDTIILANKTAAAIVGISGPIMDIKKFKKIWGEWKNE